jgi:glycosyltransferase involved in cell wall biosynthesis
MAKRQGVATMLFGHGTSKNDGTWKAAPRYALAKLADVLVTYSVGARDAYLARGWPSDRVFAAPNALDLNAIDAMRSQVLSDPQTIRAFRQKNGIGDGPLALFVARLDPPRRVDVLLQAVARLTTDFPNLQLAVIGDGPARTELQTQAARLEIIERVHFVGAVYDEAELARWFCSADLFTFPSFMGLSALHAMGYGLPIVAGNDRWSHGPEVEAVVHEKTGLLFEHNNSLAMADAIRRIITDAELRERLSRQGRALAHEQYSMPAMIDAFEYAIRAARRFAVE